MNTWWLAVDTTHTSYRSLQQRRVIAQGWPQIGDLRTIVPLAEQQAGEQLFRTVVQALAKRVYRVGDRDIDRAPDAMWALLQLRKHDVVVAIEGTTVRGLCHVTEDAVSSYLYDVSEPTEYKQTVCGSIAWHDWDSTKMGEPPVAPAQSVMALKKLKKDRRRVLEASCTVESFVRVADEK